MLANKRMSTIARLFDLERDATTVVFNRLNASTNQPAAYPVLKRACNVVEEIITVAVDRITPSLSK